MGYAVANRIAEARAELAAAHESRARPSMPGVGPSGLTYHEERMALIDRLVADRTEEIARLSTAEGAAAWEAEQARHEAAINECFGIV